MSYDIFKDLICQFTFHIRTDFAVLLRLLPVDFALVVSLPFPSRSSYAFFLGDLVLVGAAHLSPFEPSVVLHQIISIIHLSVKIGENYLSLVSS